MNHALPLPHILLHLHFSSLLSPPESGDAFHFVPLYVCVCALSVSLIMYQHSDRLTLIILSSFSLFSSFLRLISRSHGSSPVLSLYLVVQRDVYLVSVSRHSSLSLYLTSSHFLGWLDMYLSVPRPICFAIFLGLSMLLDKGGMYGSSHPSAPAHFYLTN